MDMIRLWGLREILSRTLALLLSFLYKLMLQNVCSYVSFALPSLTLINVLALLYEIIQQLQTLFCEHFLLNPFLSSSPILFRWVSLWFVIRHLSLSVDGVFSHLIVVVSSCRRRCRCRLVHLQNFHCKWKRRLFVRKKTIISMRIPIERLMSGSNGAAKST